MDIYLSLNYEWVHLRNIKYYRSVMLINVRDHQLRCKKTNSITILIENPRVHIDLCSAVFYFYFQNWPDDHMLGQVASKCHIIYNLQHHDFYDTFPCILFLRGNILEEILLYLPSPPKTFLRELQYSFFTKQVGQCMICLDESIPVINVHQDQFTHHFCIDCLLRLQLPFQCPLCREAIL